MYRLLYLILFSFLALPAVAQKIPLVNSGEVIERGKVHYDSGDYADAIKEFQKVPERDTNYVLMLAESALAHLAAQQYDEALAVCEKGLGKPSPYAPSFYRYRAIAEDKKGNLDKSVKLFHEAIEKYPADYGLLYNLGVTYYNNGQHEKAAKTFFEVLSFNPFHSGSHLNLGRIAIGQGRKTHAMLSLGMYLCISNSDNSRLVLLNNFLDNQVSDEGSISLFGVNEAEKMDQIIRAKIAMEKNFKSKIPVNAAVVRQYELFFQQLNLVGSNEADPWVKMYMPIYRFIHGNDHAETFIYYLLSSSSNAAVKKWLSKNKKTLDTFFESVNGSIKEQREVVSLAQFGYTKPVQAWYYNDNTLSALGEYTSSEIRKGQWKFYHPNHVQSAEGMYNDSGKKTGLWKYYNKDGTLKTLEDYNTGEVTVHYPDGTRREHFYLKNGEEIHGDVELFYPCGALKEKLVYQDGKRHGKGQTYHQHGTVKMTYTYANDKGNGEFKTYDATGTLREIENYKDDVLTGDYRSYFANGRLEAEGRYANDLAVGNWVHYHHNGKIERKGAYNDSGKAVGEWFYYDEDGKLTEKRPFDDEGRRHGANTHYYDDKLHYTDTYKKGVLVQSAFFDAEGKEIGNFGKADGNFFVKNYFATGQLHSEGSYRQGKNHGAWKYYNRYGKLINEYNYVDGQLQGKGVDYFPSGEKKYVAEYKDNLLHGYFQQFYRNGQVKQEGWFQDGERQQQWFTYFLDGTLESDSYYLNDSYRGPYYSYAQDGKLYSVSTYEGDILVDVKNHDRKGNVVTSKKLNNHTASYVERFANGKTKAKFDMICGNYVGEVTRWYPDGSIYYSYSFVNGQKSGPYQYNHVNGKVAMKGSFLEDKEVGHWQSFHLNGTLMSEGRYVNGEKDSVWNYYSSNGKISSTVTYRGGESHGVSRYFSPEGHPLLEKMYVNGDLIGYRIINGGEEELSWEKFDGNATIAVTGPDGKTLYEETYKGGMRDGSKKLYYQNGKLYEEYRYHNGDSEGPFVTYFPNGKVEERGSFKDDELHGVVEAFKPDGTPLKAEHYSMGVRHGSFIVYDKGKKKEVVFWDGVIE